MTRICTLNANGLRSALSKGAGAAIASIAPDVLCVQETRCALGQIPADAFPGLALRAFAPAERPGYAGTALFSANDPDETFVGFGDAEFDGEGRLCAARFGSLWTLSCYFPSGSAGPERQESKERFMPAFAEWFSGFVDRSRSEGREVLLCGDLNIARSELDLKNWKGNVKNSGFLPSERAWLNGLIRDNGLTDAWRSLRPDEPGYTWWSARGGSRDRDVGWRIDHLLWSGRPEGILACDTTGNGAPRVSDHAPLWADLLHC